MKEEEKEARELIGRIEKLGLNDATIGDMVSEIERLRAKTDGGAASPLQKIVICGFNEAWIGDCKASVAREGDRCFKHTDLTCGSCGAPATHTCAETGQFVCGATLCDDCEHTIVESGNNGGIDFNAEPPPEGMKSHCKKTEQKYKPWYAREEASI